MPWEIAQDYVVKLGGNYFVNCGQLITYDDEPLFTVKRRESDLRLGIDFDVYDANGSRVATIRNGNVVDGNRDAYEIHHGADRHKITEKSSRRIICQIDKNSEEQRVELAVSVKMYLPDGFLFEAYPDGTNIGASIMIGNVMRNLPVGIAIGDCTRRAGIHLTKPKVRS